jgi:hypothetical protein
MFEDLRLRMIVSQPELAVENFGISAPVTVAPAQLRF